MGLASYGRGCREEFKKVRGVIVKDEEKKEKHAERSHRTRQIVRDWMVLLAVIVLRISD